MSSRRQVLYRTMDIADGRCAVASVCRAVDDQAQISRGLLSMADLVPREGYCGWSLFGGEFCAEQ